MKKAARADSFSSESHLIADGHGAKTAANGHDDVAAHGSGEAHGEGGHEEHDFSEIVIHQVTR